MKEKEIIWTTVVGRRVLLENMRDIHIANIIKLLRKGGVIGKENLKVLSRGFWIICLKEEQDRRADLILEYEIY